MRLHKQWLEALLRFKGSEAVIFMELGEVAKAIASLVSPTLLEAVLSHPDFQSWKNEILKCSGTMGMFLIRYIYEVSTLLSFVVSFREKNMELQTRSIAAIGSTF